MPTFRRRHFLQSAGATLAALGLSQADILRYGQQTQRVLAQSTPRKLALLVGINAYPSGVPSLRGCITDVTMQRELLVHRYGFNPTDIVTLTDAAASREGILSAFESHLIQQAREGDVVVFHFSGHGSLILDPDPIRQANPSVQGYNGTLLPYDARLNTTGTTVNDIMGKTLFLLMSALQTEQVTVLLDSCHSGGGTRGDLQFRATEGRLVQGDARPSEREIAVQERWRQQRGWSPEELRDRRQRGIARGVAMGSANADQLAADASFGDGEGRFSAGAFTYALTRYLWQQSGNVPLSRTFIDLARSTRDVARSARIEQIPVQEVAPDSDHNDRPPYFLPPATPSAEAVITRVQGNQVEFWLGGISSQSLAAFQSGAIFSLMDGQGREVGQLEQTGRRGLVGIGQIRQGTPAVGTLLRERVRGIPPNLSLRIGLDESLGAEMATARTRLASLPRLEPVAVNGQEAPDFLLGRLGQTALTLAQQEGINPGGSLGGVGLLSPGLLPIRDSFGPAGESVEAAIARLRTQFQLLLAGRVLAAVLNSDTSNLSVGVAVQAAQSRAAVAAGGGSRGSRSAPATFQRQTANLPPLRSNQEVVIEVTNRESRDVYVGILAIGGSGRITILHPTDWDAPEAASLLPANETLTAPEFRNPRNPDRDYCENPSDEFHLCLSGRGHVEILTIISTSPLRDALRGLQSIAGARGVGGARGPLPLLGDEPLAMVNDLLQESDRATRGEVEVRSAIQAVDVNRLAAISTVIEIVE